MLRTKSVYEDKEPEDGIRILVMRKWPRGVPKDKIDRWIKKLGPSNELLDHWNKHKDWPIYKKRFFEEMTAPEKQRLIREIAELSKKRNVTLLCWEESDEYCHRRLLKELIEKI